MTAALQHWGMAHDWAWFLATFIGILLIAFPLMLAVAMIIYAERKIWAAIALRRGPNVVGPWGLLQSFADGLKVFLKETIIPTSANKGLFLIAPIVTFTVALIVWAVIPFQPGVVLADINVGLLYVLAASSLGVYGVIVAGWASNSKYPFFSALRAAAQMVSYEVSIGFVLITVVLYADSFNLTAIVLAQKGNILGLFNGFGFNPLLFPMAVVFLISSMAETFRTPFDLVEAESELVAGHQTEYSSMSFALFWLGEYANVILMCALNALLFWGGWLPPLDIGVALPAARLGLADRQDVFLLLRLRVGESDGAALPLRPADAPRVEDIPAAQHPVRCAGIGLADADEVWRMMVPLLLLAQMVEVPAGGIPRAIPPTSWNCGLQAADGTKFSVRGTTPLFPAGSDPNAMKFVSVQSTHAEAFRKPVGIDPGDAGDWFRDFQVSSGYPGVAQYTMQLKLRKEGSSIAYVTRYLSTGKQIPYEYYAVGLCNANFAPGAGGQERGR